MNENQLNEEICDRMWRFAERISTAKYLREDLRGDVSSIFFALATGQELGLAWTHSLRSTFTGRDGSLAMKGDIILALLQIHGFGVDFAFTEKPIGCTCTVSRASGAAVSRAFTMDDAQLIETRWIPDQERWERLAENYYYRNFPKAMCQWRSLAICARVAAADVIGGIYLPEELIEVKDKPVSASAPATPAQDEFIVGEKEPAPARYEVHLVTADGKDLKMEPPAPQPDNPLGEWQIAQHNPLGDPILVQGEKDQPTKEPAVLRAQTLANERGQPFYVLHGADLPIICSPPAKPVGPPRAPAPAATAPAAAATAPAPAATPAPVATSTPSTPPADSNETFTKLFGIARGKIGGKTQDADAIIGRYFAGFLGIKPVGNKVSLPKDRAKLLPPLQKLLEVFDEKAGQLKAEPEKLGEALAGRAKSALDQEFDVLQWPEKVRDLARRAIKLNNADETAAIGWLHMVVAGDDKHGTGITLASLDPVSLEIWFQLFLLIRGRAYEALDVAVATNRGVLATLQGIVQCADKKIEEWDRPFVEAMFDELNRVVKTGNQPAKPATAEAALRWDAAVVPADDDWANGGLPFET